MAQAAPIRKYAPPPTVVSAAAPVVASAPPTATGAPPREKPGAVALPLLPAPRVGAKEAPGLAGLAVLPLLPRPLPLLPPSQGGTSLPEGLPPPLPLPPLPELVLAPLPPPSALALALPPCCPLPEPCQGAVAEATKVDEGALAGVAAPLLLLEEEGLAPKDSVALGVPVAVGVGERVGGAD